MKQVLVRGGNVTVEEVPAPGLKPGQALVRVYRSLISSGTESGFVSDGGMASYVMKKARDPLNVEKVKRKLAAVGVRGTLDVIRNKLFDYQSPGYSSAGVIVECGPDIYGFRTGDRVACAGVGHASHAEYNAVPQQLLTPMPDGIGFDEAAYVALGAIALQGVRQTQPTLGETVVVIGLGLVGQLTMQLLRAAGCHTIGSDPIASKRALADSLGADATCAPGELAAVVDEWTAGYGADAVVICAASKDSALANDALDLCRHKGRVTVVGAVGMQLAREPLYTKELDFRLSCSYGPGRYNRAYEEQGCDYPIGYVRWTEGRNMAEFLRLVAEGKVRVAPLISLVKPVEQAPDAYAAVLDKQQDLISALLAYGEPDAAAAIPARRQPVRAARAVAGQVRVGVIGAGGFANAFHLPNLVKMPQAHLAAVAALSGQKAKAAADRFGAAYCTTDYRDLLADKDIDAVVIATRHNLHPAIAMEAARAGKHVFVEKPLAITVAECEQVCDAVESAGVLLSVGFNRRFSKFAIAARDALAKWHGPKMLLYRCNAGPLPPGHWTVDPVEGGGRIVGEGVHFFDLCCWLIGQDPVEVRADRLDAGGNAGGATDNNMSILLRFPDGSLATVVYCSVGHTGVAKEHIEGFGGGNALVIDDFRAIKFAGAGGKDIRQSQEHKGQYELLENWVRAIRGETALSVTARDGLRATWIAQEAIRKAQNPGAAAARDL